MITADVVVQTLKQIVLGLAQQAGKSAAAIESYFSRHYQSLLGKAGQVAALLNQRAAASPASPVLAIPPDEWTAGERTRANLAAIDVLVGAQGRELTPAERTTVARYSGWGGLSIDKIAEKIPAGWLPESRGLIHEYYTPSKIAGAVAQVLQPFLNELVPESGYIRSLEPSAGIGRFVNALTDERLRWRAVEYSKVSANLLKALRPDITVFEGPFERFIKEYESEVSGALDLVVSNPPYGARGAAATEDPSKDYKEKKAYAYFLRRALDLLRAGGIGVFLIPYGFLTGTSPPLVELRRKVLKRHHLMGAYRLPSDIFPGALLVTDLLFFRARGGEVTSLPAEEEDVAAGRYFELYPDNILGKEVGTREAEDDNTRKPRFGYEVRGTFDGLPPLAERPQCQACMVVPFAPVVSKSKGKASKRDPLSLPSHVAAALVLGERVADFLRALGQTDSDVQAQRASALYPELVEALTAWSAARVADGGDKSPYQDLELQRYAKDPSYPELITFLSAYEDEGALSPAFRSQPKYEPRYQGGRDDLVGMALFLYKQQRRLTLESLLRQYADAGNVLDEGIRDRARAALTAAGWFEDGDEWAPEADALTGHLWPKYDRAKARADKGDLQSSAQAARLLQAIGPRTWGECNAEPRQGWIPNDVMRAWLSAWTRADVPELVRHNGILTTKDTSYSGVTLGDLEDVRLTAALGYLNHDNTLFQPSPCPREKDPVTGEEEPAAQALDRCRVAYHKDANAHFAKFLAERPDMQGLMEEAYNRTFRGYVIPTYSQEALPIARARGPRKLHPYQAAGARRLVENRGGLLAFDVGLGKTSTGIATIAKLRELGVVRRPCVIVPNSIVWKWKHEFEILVSDFRVLVIGSERYIGRNGLPTSRVDTPEERALKWRQFQAGEFDVVLCTYTAFARNAIRAESIRRWIFTTPPLLRMLGLKARNLVAKVEKDEDRKEQGKPKKKGKGKAASKKAIEALAKESGKKLSEITDEEKEKLGAEAAALAQKEAAEQMEKLRTLVEGLEDLNERERAIFGEAVELWVAETLAPGDNERPDPGIYWEDLKIDFLMLDEAQNYKNLWPVQEREGGQPKYLGAIQRGSDRAWDFAVRAALVRERAGGSGVALLSATPAKNSPLEFFTLLGYVDGDAWSRLGITDPEIFIDRYLRLEFTTVLSSDFTPEKKTVVAGFRNIDELQGVVFRYAEFQDAIAVGLPLPKSTVEQVHVEMTEAQADKYSDYADEYKSLLKKMKTSASAKWRALGLLQRMALVSIHPELDAGPLNKKGKPEWARNNVSRVSTPHCPKLDKVVELSKTAPGCGHIIFCDNIGIHYWLQEVLVEADIPRERIQILNAIEADNPAKRQNIADRFNGRPMVKGDDGTIIDEGLPPEFDFIIANQIAYEGIDLQVRTCQVYHVDLPWEDATLNQRNGRAVRQGNKQAVIGIYYILSRRSTDLIRLQMILGKIKWKKDLIKTADRETTNPAAQSDLSENEMLAMLYTSPEEAKAMVELLRKEEEDAARARVRAQAWRALRGLSSRAQALPRATDDLKRTQLHAEMQEVQAYLLGLPVETWPWAFTVPVAAAGTPMAVGDFNRGYEPREIAIWEGLRVLPHALADDLDKGADMRLAGFEVGRIGADSAGVRRFGSFRWLEMAFEKPFILIERENETTGGIRYRLFETQPDDFQKPWPLQEDRDAMDLPLRSWIDTLRTVGDWNDLGLSFSPGSWRRWLWETWGQELLKALGDRGASTSLLIPLRKGTGLVLVTGTELRGKQADTLPFTDEGFDDFMDRAPRAGLKWGELNAAAMAWWGRGFPRGLLKKEDPNEGMVAVATSGGERKSVLPFWQSRGVAITPAYSGEDGFSEANGYSVTHVATGLRVAGSFPTLQHARVMAEWLLTLPVDWTLEAPDFGQSGGKIPRMTTLVREPETAPDLAQVMQLAADL